MSKARRFTDFCLVVAFVASFGAAAAGSALRVVHEWASFPTVAESAKLPAEFETFFTNRVALRGTLLKTNTALKTEVFRVSPTLRVAFGKRCWLYYEPTLEQEYLKQVHVTEEQLVGSWASALVVWQQYFESRGIDMVFVVGPDKQTVYPEFQPAGRGVRRTPSQFDRVLAALKPCPKVKVVDVREELRAERNVGDVYFHYDTHWLPRGALVGYRQTARALGLKPRVTSEYEWKPLTIQNADLPAMMSRTWGNTEIFDFPYPQFSQPSHTTKEAVAMNEAMRLKHLKPEVWEHPDTSQPKVVLVHDSFATDLYRHQLAQHCSRLVCLPANTPDVSVIDHERPKAVVHIVERVLRTGMPGLPPVVSPAEMPAQAKK